MLETQLYFNFKDMFRAPRLGLGRRMLVMLEALLASYVTLLVTTYLALLVNGDSFGAIWSDIHLLPPLVSCGATATIAHLISGIGKLLFMIFIYLGFTAVAKITIKEYKGDLFYSSRDGWKWALKKWFPVFFGPISILIVIGFFVILAAIFGWLAQWPVLDIIFYGLLFVLFLPTSIFLVFSAVSLVVGIIMSPSIVACAEEDTMGSMFGAFTLLWNQPTRLLTYLVILAGIIFLGYHIFFLAILASFKFIDMIFGHPLLMGETYQAIKQVGLGLFNNYNFLPSYYSVPDCLAVAFQADAAAASFTVTITGVLVGFVSLIAFMTIPAYALSTLATGLATAFIVLTKHKDDDDLIKRKDEDERAEEEAEEEEKAEDSEKAEKKSELSE